MTDIDPAVRLEEVVDALLARGAELEYQINPKVVMPLRVRRAIQAELTSVNALLVLAGDATEFPRPGAWHD
jgi:hypothetical protein